MEKLMSLQKYVRQVRPRNESHTSPVDKIQNFLKYDGVVSDKAVEGIVVFDKKNVTEVK